jgi:8-oxo-dGTP pyrophosphatase MutT (NUDIX family)
MIDRLATRLALGEDLRPPVDGQRRAAVAAVLHGAGPDGPRVLLMKRSERPGDPWSGHISLPGGRFEVADGDLRATAIRETQEELAIDLHGARLLGNLPRLHPLTAGPQGIEVTPFVFVTEDAPRPQLSAEAEGAFWLPLPLVASGALDGIYRHPAHPMDFPCWTYEGHTIWGLTLRILRDLLDRAA